ncbi:cupin domain-containing protein [Christensenella tenuis]|jgi:mannose-6-phosphate isomerase-like protein (cupin superfamily)|uniref:Cupin domain-containing protein n=1 Tax=Christensenella tenuis TaxID=2763033 RepID=A0ABR7EFY3_9FIRM|nr:cupin domain-containing protein [Christensenella tenuis]MBC5648667.1 cupin domain-containing protein [Christensenella tenuis]
MRIDFNQLDETEIKNFYGGKQSTYARMFADENNRIMHGRLAPGASIGPHPHETGSEIIFILSGTGKAFCDGAGEVLAPGVCHYCPKGHTHSLIADGMEALVFFAVVPQQ